MPAYRQEAHTDLLLLFPLSCLSLFSLSFFSLPPLYLLGIHPPSHLCLPLSLPLSQCTHWRDIAHEPGRQPPQLAAAAHPYNKREDARPRSSFRASPQLQSSLWSGQDTAVPEPGPSNQDPVAISSPMECPWTGHLQVTPHHPRHR